LGSVPEPYWPPELTEVALAPPLLALLAPEPSRRFEAPLAS
jgi:hypothetical protein